MQYRIKHSTCYDYEKAVSFGDHFLYLRPQDGPCHKVESFITKCEPQAKLRWLRDSYNNLVLAANFGLTEYTQMRVDCEILLTLKKENPFNFVLDRDAKRYPFNYHKDDIQALQPYLHKSAQSGAEHVLDWFYTAVPNPNGSDNLVQFLIDLNTAIRRDIAYEQRDEEGIQSPSETLAKRQGSCRDMAVLFIAVCQQLGFAARFVSGYLYVPPGEDRKGYNMESARGSMHAWAEVYLPGAGWKGFDPTNAVLTSHYSIPTATASQPLRVNPIQGKYFNKGQVPSQMHIDLTITEVAQ